MCPSKAPARRREQLGMRHRVSASPLKMRQGSKRSSPLMTSYGLPASPGSTIAIKLCPLGEINSIHQEGIKDSPLRQLIRLRFAITSSWMMTTLPHLKFRGGRGTKNHRGPPDTQHRSSVTRMSTSLMKTVGSPIKCTSLQVCS